MNGIRKLRKYLEDHPKDQASMVLVRLIMALEKNDAFHLGDLYELDYNEFSLAMEILEDWRLDRYYASETGMLDGVLNGLDVDGVRKRHS